MSNISISSSIFRREYEADSNRLELVSLSTTDTYNGEKTQNDREHEPVKPGRILAGISNSLQIDNAFLEESTVTALGNATTNRGGIHSADVATTPAAGTAISTSVATSETPEEAGAKFEAMVKRALQRHRTNSTDNSGSSNSGSAQAPSWAEMVPLMAADPCFATPGLTTKRKQFLFAALMSSLFPNPMPTATTTTAVEQSGSNTANTPENGPECGSAEEVNPSLKPPGVEANDGVKKEKAGLAVARKNRKRREEVDRLLIELIFTLAVNGTSMFVFGSVVIVSMNVKVHELTLA
jgi:hypothetical protein